jgi:hypothetical protein
MPKPFIVFESHVSPAARQLLADNVKLLKGLGYQKFLIEMNMEINPASFKEQLVTVLKNSAASIHHPPVQALLNLISALEANNIPLFQTYPNLSSSR